VLGVHGIVLLHFRATEVRAVHVHGSQQANDFQSLSRNIQPVIEFMLNVMILSCDLCYREIRHLGTNASPANSTCSLLRR